MPLETYVTAERLIWGTGGISGLCELSLACLSVLYLKLLQLQKRKSLLVNNVDLESIMRSQSVKREVILEYVVFYDEL